MGRKVSREIPLKNIRVADGFFTPIQNLAQDVMIPYQERVMDDMEPGAEKSHAFENFRLAAGEAQGEFEGMVFQDSDVAKWIEAVAYSLAIRPDPALEARADKLIALIGRAQQPDGYLNTYFTVKYPERRWQNLQESHELYCAGHMLEAAIAYYEATGKDALLTIMRRMCDHIDARFGPGKLRGIPGHEEIELALMRLYRVTGEKKYFDLAAYFIDERGTEPDYFAEEVARRDWWQFGNAKSAGDRTYWQDHLPVRAQQDAEGHSVRAMYLYTAMADMASYTDDEALWDACKKLWDSTTQKRMYVTGGIGSTVEGERFTIDHDLPNDSAYTETCASIGLMFFAKRMLEKELDGKYADVMERALYNGVISGMQQDGQHFFYCNPLEVIPGVSGALYGFRHALPQRPGWYACACCPPNLARLLTSLGQYAWAEGDDTVYSHLYIGGKAGFSVAGGVDISLKTKYPWEGTMAYTVNPGTEGTSFTFAIRVPGWCKGATLSINGEQVDCGAVTSSGYAMLTRAWKQGDVVTLVLPMAPRRVYANTAVRADAGCVAIVCGPLVYALEGVDNGADVSALRMPRDAKLNILAYDPTLLGGIRPITADGIRETSTDALYADTPPAEEAVTLRAIPYYAWGNRGETSMRVWIRE